jgi:hypothetical protein
MKITCKKGVQFSVLRDHIWKQFEPICSVFALAGYECIITCGTEDHGPNDPHTHGYALDLRSWHIKSEDEKKAIETNLQIVLGDDYYVIYEPKQPGEHYHIQVKKGLWRYLMEHE